ncbi:MAG TPA: hypothetical protein VFN94_04990, partial [Nitrospiria bacterium]|nr:hypothetical protein [Nitrospiria bacterium]
MDRRNILQGLAALSALAVGVLVYALDRPGASAAFLPATWPSDGGHRTFGIFGGQIPDLAHVYAFSLLTALALGASRRAAALSCGLWFGIDGLFEIAQHPAISATLPVTFQRLRGTFDPWDLAALALGAAAAYFTIRTINADYRDAVAAYRHRFGRNAIMISLVCVGLLTILGSEVGGGEEGGDG